MKTIEANIELIFHYRCSICQQWWSIADKSPRKGQSIFCPNCGTTYRLSAIVAHTNLPQIDRFNSK